MRFTNIGVLVSPAPRRTPVVTTCKPSKIWNTAATDSSGIAIFNTSELVVNSEISGRGISRNTIAATVMNPPPRQIANQPDCLAA
jgi:hypothetical protein